MFRLKIETDNAAFQESTAQEEIARILREIASKLDGLDDSGKVYDGNGNYVGDWKLK